MAGNKKKTAPTESEQKFTWSPPLRGLVSALLVVHLVIVVATPMAMMPPRSQLAESIRQLAAPYVEGGNISHGYAFFAPNPGPSYIVRYTLRFPDGREEQGVFPDLQRHWPRLRYHRHFMLTEQLNGMDPGPDPRGPAESGVELIDPPDSRWTAQRDEFVSYARSYARHLLKAREAEEVQLHLVEHNIPSREQVLAGTALDDDDLYETYVIDPLVVVRREDD